MNKEGETSSNGNYMIYCDTAWISKEEMAGVGFIIKDKHGATTDKGSNFRRAFSPLAAEIWSIWHGMSKASELNIAKVEYYE
ncbi:hypothetical protein Cni_G22507 [Canna indica]|uniref:RNase H type-1 domain-containing protein n=1 Tax=Canna indica TaxID=4628 RepID=A0AAQ3KSK8_9LILI|nr:hypothetical protein Cni_G22507 [Canna indica]